MGNDEQSKLDRLQSRLYSRKNPVEVSNERSGFTDGEKAPVTGEWASQESEGSLHDALHKGQTVKKRSFLGKLFVLSLLFFVISVGIAAVVFLSGYNKVSPNNVDISVLGPVSTSAGDELSLDIIVKNGNAVDLEGVVLTVRYPEGTRSPRQLTVPLTLDTIDVGTVPAGGSVTRTVKAVLFGEKDTVQSIEVQADYKIKLSTSPHKKEKQFDIAIKSAPVIMTVNYPNEVNSGHEVKFDIDITSNTNSDIENLALAAQYPFGFSFKSSDPAPFEGTSVWHLGKLKPLEKRHITILGSIDAQNNEERTFSFVAGTPLPEDDRKIGVTLSSTMQSIVVKKPEISLQAIFQNGKDSIALNQIDRAQLTINWKNNLPINVQNITISAKLSGNIFDPTTVSPSVNGYYRTLDHTVIWDKNQISQLAEATPGREGGVGVNIGPLRQYDLRSIKDPQIIADVTVSATRLAEGGVPETITTSAQRIVRIQSVIDVAQRLVYSIGPFANTGPIPLKVDNETTYTVIWDASNTFNNVVNARVLATLPVYASWKGAISPATEALTYNPDTREIIWNIKSLPRGTGTLSAPREVMFQIGVIPTLYQSGSLLNVLNPFVMTGYDEFARTNLETRGPHLNSDLTTDPKHDPKDGIVVK